VPATLGLEILPAVQELVQHLQASRDAQARGTTLWNEYDQRLQKAVELSKKLVQNIGNAGQGQQDVNAELDKTLDKLELQASRIQSAARGALQLAQAFGIVDDNLANAVNNVVQIATAIPQVSAVLKSGASITKALPGILSIAGGLAGLIGGLFGPDPEEQRRKEVLRENTEALRKLTDRIGEFGVVDTTGTRFTQIQDLLTRLQTQTGFLGNAGRGPFGFLQTARGLKQIEAQMGITPQELKDFAEALGITFANLQPTVAELRQLNEALAQTQLTQFSQTFAGQIEMLSRQFDLFDISDPIEQLQKLSQVALKFADSPLIDSLLGGIDLSSAAGRAELEQRIRDLFMQLNAGTITPAQLGGLTPQQLIDLLSQLETTMDQVAQGQEQGQTQQFQVSREITEVTAGRLVSIGVTSLLWLQEIAENTRGLLPSGLQPPTAAALAAFTQPASSVVIESIVINVQPPVGMSQLDAQTIARQLGTELLDTIDREYGTRVRRRALMQGNVNPDRRR
jgi:uncharacterized phage infection (PIP) family protein YhgE